MKIKITEKKEIPVFSRTEIKALLDFEKQTPSGAEVRKELAKSLKADEYLLVVKKIGTSYGSKTANITAYLYKEKFALEKLEPTPKKTKKPEEGAEEKPAEKKEDKPKEEKKVGEKPAKEESPKEEKKPEEKPKEKK